MTRASLRSLDEADRARLLTWRASPQVSAFMYSDHQISAEEHNRWFNGIAGDSRRRFWVIEAEDAPVGLTNLADIDTIQGRATIARYIADPTVRGRGVGGFAEFKVLDHAFFRLGLRKLWSEVLETNTVAWRLHMAHGFQREALLRSHVIKNGLPANVVGLGLLADEWRAIRPAARQHLIDKGYAAETLESPIPD